MDKNCCTGKSNWKIILLVVLLGGMLLMMASGRELGLGSYLPFMIFLICPLMHLGMFALLFKGKKEKNAQSEVEQA